MNRIFVFLCETCIFISIVFIIDFDGNLKHVPKEEDSARVWHLISRLFSSAEHTIVALMIISLGYESSASAY